MKKIFLIIAGCFTAVIVAILIATNFIYITENIASKQPKSINIYKNSTTILNNKSYTSDDGEFDNLIKKVENVGKVSIFDRLISQSGLDNAVRQSGDNDYSNVISDVRKSNYCIEYIYESNQDKIITINGNTKVISYNRLLYVFPTTSGVTDIIVYYANDKGYENYNPLLFYGKTQEIINTINSL